MQFHHFLLDIDPKFPIKNELKVHQYGTVEAFEYFLQVLRQFGLYKAHTVYNKLNHLHLLYKFTYKNLEENNSKEAIDFKNQIKKNIE